MAKARSLHDAAHRWLRENPEAIKFYAGKWVSVTGTGVNLADDDREKLERRCWKDGNLNPLIFLVPGGFQEA